MKKPIRSQSGVAVITLLLKPYSCPGRCIYCPTESSMPKSYLQKEPAAQRAFNLEFNPFLQVVTRLLMLYRNGHNVNKAEIIIDGGTWSNYPKKYRDSFVSLIFIACNLFTPKVAEKLIEYRKDEQIKDLLCSDDSISEFFDVDFNELKAKKLRELQKVNSLSYVRIVGLSIEERPQTYAFNGSITINAKLMVKSLRKYGVTKIQLGIQSLNDRILKLNKRDCTKRDILIATEFLRVNGFKLNVHIMQNLLGATVKSDLQDYKELMRVIMPDEVKIYPTVLFKNTELYNEYLNGNYKQYSFEELVELIIKMKSITPKFVRINRIFRDLPTEYMQGVKIPSNIREYVQREMKLRGLSCNCVRCRQVKSAVIDPKRLKFLIMKYRTGGGINYFLQYLSNKNELLGLLRLFIPSNKIHDLMLNSIRGCAIIREVHVYGITTEFAKQGNVQHLGLGRKLITKAEKIAQGEGCTNLSVIAGIGTQEYYSKLGYKLVGDNFMKKNIEVR